MNAMADEAEASTPDYSPDEEDDALRARESDDYWASMYEREEPDAHDDSDPYGYDDQVSEYGMDGCCGDF